MANGNNTSNSNGNAISAQLAEGRNKISTELYDGFKQLSLGSSCRIYDLQALAVGAKALLENDIEELDTCSDNVHTVTRILACLISKASLCCEETESDFNSFVKSKAGAA